MEPLSWNEIRERAQTFAREWEAGASEKSDAKTFWDEFFNIFGIQRKLVATFEEPVKAIKGRYHYIDLFWPGKMLVEHKSAGQDLAKASSQAFNYMRELESEGRRDELPRYVVLSDFQRFVIYDLEPTDEDGKAVSQADSEPLKFDLKGLAKNIRTFAFLRGEKALRRDPEDPANIKAAELMGKLHSALEKGGFKGHDLERLLVRILFCLFAEDTSVFDPNSFAQFIQNRTRQDGSDLGAQLNRLFDVLNTPETKRQKSLEEDLAVFPYVNGALFEEPLRFAEFDSKLRTLLIDCTRFNWARISPGVFGSLFQSIMSGASRREQGAHYTSEADILKVIRPLFLDDLDIELQAIKNDKVRRESKLDDFCQKLARIKLLDPACGCGNFLVVAYRELRLLELKALKIKIGGKIGGLQGELTMDVNKLSKVNVDQMYGIELDEWPARIAEVAIWLMDHQMNMEVSEAFHQRYIRIPLKASPHIKQANALGFDWNELLSSSECAFILGNPPYVGKKEQNEQQKKEMATIFDGVSGVGVLDYVTAWYVKAAKYMANTNILCAFVSTNSITQGEQVGLLWSYLQKKLGVHIWFAHRTFAWTSEARGKAHVHVVIIGFGLKRPSARKLYSYDDIKGLPVLSSPKNINPYLVDAPDVYLLKLGNQISGAPEISYGSMANDRKKLDKGLGNLILDNTSKKELLKACPGTAKFIRPFVGSEEFLNNTERWCLWLVDAAPEELRGCKAIMERVDAVRLARLESERGATKKLAETPHLFGEIRQPKTNYLLIPKVSSETRPYLPIGFMKPNAIANGSALIIPGANEYHFGILSSAMHMAWMRYVCGRMKSDYQYSSQIVYSNFPWPEIENDVLRDSVKAAANSVIEMRKTFKNSTLADLYDPLTMPLDLRKSHVALDKAVDKCYRKEPFGSERERVEYLFSEYQKLTNPLGLIEKDKSKRKSK